MKVWNSVNLSEKNWARLSVLPRNVWVVLLLAAFVAISARLGGRTNWSWAVGSAPQSVETNGLWGQSVRWEQEDLALAEAAYHAGNYAHSNRILGAIASSASTDAKLRVAAKHLLSAGYSKERAVDPWMDYHPTPPGRFPIAFFGEDSGELEGMLGKVKALRARWEEIKDRDVTSEDLADRIRFISWSLLVAEESSLISAPSTPCTTSLDLFDEAVEGLTKIEEALEADTPIGNELRSQLDSEPFVAVRLEAVRSRVLGALDQLRDEIGTMRSAERERLEALQAVVVHLKQSYEARIESDLLALTGNPEDAAEKARAAILAFEQSSRVVESALSKDVFIFEGEPKESQVSFLNRAASPFWGDLIEEQLKLLAIVEDFQAVQSGRSREEWRTWDNEKRVRAAHDAILALNQVSVRHLQAVAFELGIEPPPDVTALPDVLKRNLEMNPIAGPDAILQRRALVELLGRIDVAAMDLKAEKGAPSGYGATLNVVSAQVHDLLGVTTTRGREEFAHGWELARDDFSAARDLAAAANVSAGAQSPSISSIASAIAERFDVNGIEQRVNDLLGKGEWDQAIRVLESACARVPSKKLWEQRLLTASSRPGGTPGDDTGLHELIGKAEAAKREGVFSADARFDFVLLRAQFALAERMLRMPNEWTTGGKVESSKFLELRQAFSSVLRSSAGEEALKARAFECLASAYCMVLDPESEETLGADDIFAGAEQTVSAIERSPNNKDIELVEALIACRVAQGFVAFSREGQSSLLAQSAFRLAIDAQSQHPWTKTPRIGLFGSPSFSRFLGSASHEINRELLMVAKDNRAMREFVGASFEAVFGNRNRSAELYESALRSYERDSGGAASEARAVVAAVAESAKGTRGYLDMLYLESLVGDDRPGRAESVLRAGLTIAMRSPRPAEVVGKEVEPAEYELALTKAATPLAAYALGRASATKVESTTVTEHKTSDPWRGLSRNAFERASVLLTDENRSNLPGLDERIRDGMARATEPALFIKQAAVYAQEGRLAAAQREAELGIKFHPQNAKLWSLASRYRFQAATIKGLSEPRRARADFSSLLDDLDAAPDEVPGMPFVKHFWRGRVAHYEFEFERARQAYELALQSPLPGDSPSGRELVESLLAEVRIHLATTAPIQVSHRSP